MSGSDNVPAWAAFYNNLKAEIATGQWDATDVHTLLGPNVMAILFTGVAEPNTLVGRLMYSKYDCEGTSGILGRRVITAAPIGGPDAVMAMVEYDNRQGCDMGTQNGKGE